MVNTEWLYVSTLFSKSLAGVKNSTISVDKCGGPSWRPKTKFLVEDSKLQSEIADVGQIDS